MTALPIDYNWRPWRAKYIDTETLATNAWSFMRYGGDKDVGDIHDGTTDILINVPADVAGRIVAARQHFVDVLLAEIGYQQETT